MKPVILELLRDAPEGVKVKKLRKKTIEQQEEIEDQKEAKSKFTSILDTLVTKGKILISDDIVTLIESSKGGKRKQQTEDENEPTSKSKKSRKSNNSTEEDISQDVNDCKSIEVVERVELNDSKELWKNGEQAWRDGSLDDEYLQKNPDRITRLFCGNLNRNVTEEELHNCIPGITYIKWIVDKQTREFYGSTFLEMNSAQSASAAVLKDKSKFMGRPLKIYYCPPKPGDVWPPETPSNRGVINSQSSNNFSANGKRDRERNEGDVPKRDPNSRERTPKPPGCTKLFAGNLSYEIDDAVIIEFFKDCGELIGLRWLTKKDTGEFRGCGFIQFATTEEADAAKALDGQDILGRPVRLDWTT